MTKNSKRLFQKFEFRILNLFRISCFEFHAFFRARRRKSSGFSLIEILLATGILLSAFVVFLSTWLATITNINLRRTSIASHIATRKMEELRSTAFSNLPGSGPFFDPDLSKLPGGSANLAISDYLATSSIKHVVITVSWREGRATSTYRLDTLFTSGGTNPP